MTKGFFYPRTETGRSSLIPAPPWYYSGDLLTVEYRTDPARVAELLPAPLELAPRTPARSRSSGRTGSPARRAARSCSTRSARSTRRLRRRPLRYAGTVYSRCVYIWVDKDFAIARGIHQGYRRRVGPPDPAAPVRPGRAADRVLAGCSARRWPPPYRRIAQATLRITGRRRRPTASSTATRGSHRDLPGIAKGSERRVRRADRLRRRPASRRARRGPSEASLDLFDSPTEELARLLGGAGDHRRLLPPGRRRLGRRQDAGAVL